jgi:uncharacterized SAM-binding protein YcdF (DUF218 family)
VPSGIAPLLHGVVPVFLLPLGFSIFLVAGGAVCRRWKFVWLACGVLYLSGIPAIGNLLLGTLENRFPYIEVADCEKADAIVVLSGYLPGEQRSSKGTLEWREGVDRFERGLDLLAAGKAPVLVFTTDFGIKAEAVRRGARTDAIVITEPAWNTAGEAAAVARKARQAAWRRIILVTSAYHMPRAEMLFRRTGLELIPFPADYLSYVGTPTVLMNFLPRWEGLQQTETGLREYYGIAYYKWLRPWTPARAAR